MKETDFTELQKLIKQCNEAYYEQMPPREEITEDEEIKLNFERFLNVISYLETLEKYMTIQEELGIPLEVLFKALKDGIWTKGGYYSACYLDKKPKFVKGDRLHIGYYDYYQYDNEELENHFAEDNALCIFSMDYEEYIYVTRLKDYGVTWALTREELGND